MSFTMEFAASLVRSSKKALKKRQAQSHDSSQGSPTSVAALTGEEDPEEDIENEADRSDILDMLSLEPLDDIAAPPDIKPIPVAARQRNRRIEILPTLGEKECLKVLDSDSSCGSSSKESLAKVKKKPTQAKKVTKVERIKELMGNASEAAGTGDEEDGIKTYKKALRLADLEIDRLKGLLFKSLEKHPATFKSIQTRVQEDLLEVVLLAGEIKTKMTILYERQGDYDNAMVSIREARALYRKQKKRSPKKTLKNGATEIGNTSPGSKTSSDSERSIVWYVACPKIDELLQHTDNFLSRMKQAQSSFDDRRRMVEEILMIREEIAETKGEAMREKLYSRAVSMAKNALVIESTALGDSHPQVADILQLLSVLMLEQQNAKHGYRDKAIQYLLQSLSVNQKSLGPKHPRTGQDLLRMARLYQQPLVMGVSREESRSLQDEDRAIAYFHQAAEVFRAVEGGQKVVGSILNDVAVIHVSRGEFHKALGLLRQSLASYESELGRELEGGSSGSEESNGNNHSAEVCVDAVQVWRNMGECYVNIKDFDKAIECFVSALDIQRDARKRHDVVPDSESDLSSAGQEEAYEVHIIHMVNDESIADTLRRLGKAFTAATKVKEALVVFREAVQIHQRAVVDAKARSSLGPTPELPLKQDQLANTLYCVAETYIVGKDYDAAIKLFNESMQLRIASDGQRAEGQRCNMVHCAMCLVGLGNVHFAKREFVEAHKFYSSALNFCKAQGIPYSNAIVKMIVQKQRDSQIQIADDPNRSYELLRLEEKAEAERRRGAFKQAIASITEALTIRQVSSQRMKGLGLDASKEIAATVRLLHSLGHVYTSMGDEEKAHRSHKEAVMMHRQIPSASPVATAK